MDPTKIYVVVPAAGFGTRLLPGSKSIPKEMFPVVNKPAIEYIAEETVDAGLLTMVLITSKNKDPLVDHFDRNYELESILKDKKKDMLLDSILKYEKLRLINIRQKEALGLGHAVYMANSVLNRDCVDPFVVMLPDMIIKNGYRYLKTMIDIYYATGKAVIALMEVPYDEVYSYGIVKSKAIDLKDYDLDITDDTLLIEDMIEKPSVDEAPSNLAIVGRYVLPTKILGKLETAKPSSGGEIQLTDALKELSREEGVIGVVIRDEIHDIGNPIGFIKANISYCLENEKYAEQIINYFKSIVPK